MSTALPDLVPLWTFLLALAVFFYVLLDGFDLGVGMLYTLAPQGAWRTLIMNSIAPIWDGNETWLVFGCLGLLAAFPLVFAILIPALYFPVLLILIGLIFRGVAFEFRQRELTHPGFWDRAFGFGSLLASFAQGIVIGAFIQGFEVEGRHFSGLLRSLTYSGLRSARRRMVDSENRGTVTGMGAPRCAALPYLGGGCAPGHIHMDPADG
jgi:cytochrome bd ubiquinol oxidase subunit II